MNATVLLRMPIYRRPLPRVIPNVCPVYQFNRPNTFSLSHPPANTFAKSARFNMREAIVAKGPKVSIHDVPVPKPNADQVSLFLDENAGFS